MANVKIMLWKDNKTVEKYQICLRIIQNRKPAYYFTKFNSSEKDWNTEKSRLYKSHANSKEINLYLDNLEAKTNKIILSYETTETPYSAATIKNILTGKVSNTDLIQYIKQITDEYLKMGKYGNARVYKLLPNFLKKYTGLEELAFDDINYNRLKKIELLYMSAGHKVNGLSLYMRTLRAVV